MNTLDWENCLLKHVKCDEDGRKTNETVENSLQLHDEKKYT